MTIIQSIILGIVQGIGEFLPISSSAHLTIVPFMFGWKESSLACDIALHFGTLLAVLAIYFTEWWKQLYGESEGKDQKGIFPAGVDFTTDLHSMGQYIQEGRRNLFETVISIEKPKSDITINSDEDNLDGLNYLSGKTLDYVNKKAMEGTVKAHVSGDVPNIMINIENLDEENIGELIYFFEKACAMSGMILGVNPFNQPGVEEYKKNMFKLLKKPGI